MPESFRVRMTPADVAALLAALERSLSDPEPSPHREQWEGQRRALRAIQRAAS